MNVWFQGFQLLAFEVFLFFWYCVSCTAGDLRRILDAVDVEYVVGHPRRAQELSYLQNKAIKAIGVVFDLNLWVKGTYFLYVFAHMVMLILLLELESQSTFWIHFFFQCWLLCLWEEASYLVIADGIATNVIPSHCDGWYLECVIMEYPIIGMWDWFWFRLQLHHSIYCSCPGRNMTLLPPWKFHLWKLQLWYGHRKAMLAGWWRPRCDPVLWMLVWDDFLVDKEVRYSVNGLTIFLSSCEVWCSSSQRAICLSDSIGVGPQSDVSKLPGSFLGLLYPYPFPS